MTHKQKVFALLSDGRPHTHHELYALGCVAHSRVADLRRDGHHIEQWRDANSYWYRLMIAPTVPRAAAFSTLAAASATVGANCWPEASNPLRVPPAITVVRDGANGQLAFEVAA